MIAAMRDCNVICRPIAPLNFSVPRRVRKKGVSMNSSVNPQATRLCRAVMLLITSLRLEENYTKRAERTGAQRGAIDRGGNFSNIDERNKRLGKRDRTLEGAVQLPARTEGMISSGGWGSRDFEPWTGGGSRPRFRRAFAAFRGIMGARGTHGRDSSATRVPCGLKGGRESWAQCWPGTSSKRAGINGEPHKKLYRKRIAPPLGLSSKTAAIAGAIGNQIWFHKHD